MELVNPREVARCDIREEGKHGRDQTFRYAPPSSGFEAVRKILFEQLFERTTP
jgi:hypothetical protein